MFSGNPTRFSRRSTSFSRTSSNRVSRECSISRDICRSSYSHCHRDSKLKTVPACNPRPQSKKKKKKKKGKKNFTPLGQGPANFPRNTTTVHSDQLARSFRLRKNSISWPMAIWYRDFQMFRGPCRFRLRLSTFRCPSRFHSLFFSLVFRPFVFRFPLIDWLMDGLIAWLIDWWSDWLSDWLIHSFTHSFIHGLIDWWMDGLIDWLIDDPIY